MKILNTIHAQSIGGVDQVFRSYTEVLAKNGHEVFLLISDSKEYTSSSKYKSKDVKKIFGLKNFSQIFDFLKLGWILITLRPDFMICHSRRLMKWMRLFKFLKITKSIAVNHGVTFDSSLHCDYVININKQISDLVIASGFDQSKSFILPNCIKIDHSYQQKVIKNPVVIGMYGRVEPRKGFDFLMKAAALLKQNGLDFRLKLGGFEVPGSYNWNRVKALAEELNILEKCEFVGIVIDKKKFFSDVDIFCVPSTEEPFGLVILEGFLHSTLVISSDSDGGKSLIKSGVDGFLFENQNYTDLAEKILKVCKNSEGNFSYSSLTSKAFTKLEKEFSLNSLGKNLEKILRACS